MQRWCTRFYIYMSDVYIYLITICAYTVRKKGEGTIFQLFTCLECLPSTLFRADVRIKRDIVPLTTNEYCVAGGTVPSSLWLRGRTAWPRKRPASSGPWRLRLTIDQMTDNCQLLQRKCAPFPNKSFGKNAAFVVIDTKSMFYVL